MPNAIATVMAVSPALLSATSDSLGDIPEALAYVDFFANHYDGVILRPAS